ncbi:unnamed protein product [Rhizopus stolonifer]
MLKFKQDTPPLGRISPWNARVSKIDRGHLIPMLTPSYPSTCIIHNDTLTTKNVIIGELKATTEIVQDIMTGIAS